MVVEGTDTEFAGLDCLLALLVVWLACIEPFGFCFALLEILQLQQLCLHCQLVGLGEFLSGEIWLEYVGVGAFELVLTALAHRHGLARLGSLLPCVDRLRQHLSICSCILPPALPVLFSQTQHSTYYLLIYYFSYTHYYTYNSIF